MLFDVSDAPFTFEVSGKSDVFVADPFVFELTADVGAVDVDLSKTFTASPFFIRLSIGVSQLVESVVIDVRNAPLVFRLNFSGVISQFHLTGAEIWGSRIGSLQWKLDERNEAFRRPTLSRGSVLQMAKIGARVIIFSEYGIDYTEPSERYWKYEHVGDYGLLSSWAFTHAAKDEVWFLDSRKHLIRLNADGFHDFDCSMWFTENNYVMSWDHKWSLLYISGENEGFVYNPTDDSFGRGINGITGISADNAVVGHGSLEPGNFELCTNAYDLGSRSAKTIRSVEFSIHVHGRLEAAIDFRYRNDMDWRTTPWKRVNPSGVAYIPCYGLEFRFRLRSNSFQNIHLDQIRVMGTIHGYDFLNAIGWAPNSNQNG